MTGIERLRELLKGIYDALDMCGVTVCLDDRPLKDVLSDIADQIEREHAEDCFKMGERAADATRAEDEQALCVELGAPLDEGADPLDVLRRYVGCLTDTIENLRLELGEQSDAIAWVRDHGGLDAVKARWEGCVPASWLEKAKSRYERKRDNLKAHAWELERKCAERRERIRELDKAIAEMRPRLMPEGMCWPMVDGKLVDFTTGYEPSLGVLEAVSIYSNGACEVMSHDGIIKNVKDIHVSKPKVLDADGAEIRVGDTVYHVKDGSKMTVFGIEGEWIVVSVGGRARHDIVTHRAPVLAADGRPLREGETVWYRDHIDPLEVRGISTTESGAQYVKAYNDYEGEVSAPAEDFTHDRPVADTWERLEEDAGKNPFDYCKDVGHRLDTCENSEAYKARDLVRRCRALAERERGE